LATGSQVRASTTYLSRRWLSLARTIWILYALLILVVFMIAMPAYLRQIQQDHYQFGPILEQYGLDIGFFGLYILFWNSLMVLVCLSVGLLICWRKSNDWFGLLVSGVLISFITYPPVISDLGRVHPGWITALNLLRISGGLALLLVFYIFPDGRFFLTWTRYTWIGLSVFLLIVILTSNVTLESAPININTPLQGIVLFVFLFMFITGAYAQMYRFRRISDPIQRQQLKWVVFGFIVFSLGLTLGALPAFVFPVLRTARSSSLIFTMINIPVSIMSMLALPLSLAISILKYRLWNIDVIIRRTLVYGVLTLMVAAIYFGGVLLLQTLIQGTLHQSQSPFAILITTLGIASIFTPLRRRIQMDIDRRFYRQKYDADKMLRAFAQRARDDVDLENLQKDIISVVEETLHPGKLSLWVRPKLVQEELSRISGSGEPFLSRTTAPIRSQTTEAG
jgi:hypothetical protein